MAKWLDRQGARVRVADTRKNPPNVDGLRAAVPLVEVHAGPFDNALLDGVDLLALSPGVPVTTPLVQAAKVPVWSEVELFMNALRELERPTRLLAVTGSNGKTTTTALTAHLLNAAGVPAVACGNISPSLLDALMDALDHDRLPQVWVAELSSFQLETTLSLRADGATVLNVSEDHLDRHGDMSAYAAAKARIFQGTPVRVLNRDDDWSLAMGGCGVDLVTFGLGEPPRSRDYGLCDGALCLGKERLVALADLPIKGLHNAANVMAALALCASVGLPAARALTGLADFHGLPHRVESVCEIGGVLYVDDSKGTNVGATLAAIEGLGCPVAIVLGGEGKGQDFSPLLAALKQHGRAIALIGRDAPSIGVAVAASGLPQKLCEDMDGAVAWLATQARPGDCVLLSPACASLDMYRNYAHRAEVFVAAVRRIAAERGGRR